MQREKKRVAARPVATRAPELLAPGQIHTFVLEQEGGAASRGDRLFLLLHRGRRRLAAGHLELHGVHLLLGQCC